MRYRIQFFLIAAVVTAMLAGCAGGESNIPFYEGLAYDEVEHISRSMELL